MSTRALPLETGDAPPRLALRPAERRLVLRLGTPEKVQRWLSGLPYNWERRGATARTFRGVVRTGTAHCLEAALSSACILEQHGIPPLLLDIESTDRLDHVLHVFQRGGLWGAVGRSRCPGLHGRKPAFRSLETLVRSYMAPYIDQTGRVKGYGLLDLRDLPTGQWRLAPGNVFHVEDALNDNRHAPLRTPDLDFRLWKGRFDRWWEAHGRPDHAWPVHYPAKDRALWMR
ncbi:MAG TPA: hypothetical protein VJ874_00775 [Candidatus Thermoplasmatota archaeon]|nr:hypothetical protein [Candidatus Thermoplasmatota archaeon]